ncbi:nucleophile aminohydrolase [Lentinula edodes]|nr:nucleophile aminohydrolase [Lentinula edodes]
MTRSALTVFSPDGHLFQVEYTLVAVRKGTCAVGVRSKDVVVLGVEKKAILQLQDPQTVRTMAMLDDHVCLAFADLTADGRVLIDKARIECHSHSHHLTVGDLVTAEYIMSAIRNLEVDHLISYLHVAFDPHDTKPHLPMTEPNGICSAWHVIFLSAICQTYVLTLPI